MKNKFFAIILSVVLSLPVAVWAVDSTLDAESVPVINQIDEDITVHSVDPKFEESDHDGLKNYLDGFVKEGAGAGGAMFTALARGVPLEKLRKKLTKEQ